MQKRIFIWIFILTIILLCAAAKSYLNFVRVKIFSLHNNLKEVKITGNILTDNGSSFGEIKIIASDKTLEIINLKTPQKKYADELNLNIKKIVKIETDTGGYKFLSGTLIIKNLNSSLFIINKISIEDYITGVISGELKRTDLLELNKAQAVASRSFALTHLKNHAFEGYDFCDSTHCQLYRGISFSPPAFKATFETKDEVLACQDEIVPGYFHSTCGGKTADGFEIFQKFIPGITRVEDKLKNNDFLCKDSEHFIWNTVFSKDEIACTFPEISRLKDLKITSFGKSGRALEIILIGNNAKKISSYNFWIKIGHLYGWGKIKSTYFKVYKKNDKFFFSGRGLGHGLGMCQTGSEKLARLGYNYKLILKHYFPQSKLKRIN